MQVTQLINSNGNPAANQFVITTDHGQYFQSYKTVIAYKPRTDDTPVLSSKWDYSQTTLKHLKLFLGTSASKADLQKQIKAGSLIIDSNLSITE